MGMMLWRAGAHARVLGVICAVAGSLVLATDGFGQEGSAAPDLAKLKGQIVLSSDRSGPWRIWIVEANGAAMRQLTKGESDAHDVDPMSSPDGKTVLFSSTRGGKTGIWTVPMEGGQPKRLCDGDQAEWAPDGARIAFRRDNRIWLRDLTTGEEKGFSPKDWPHCSGPAWSPDGKTIAFAARWDAGNGVYLLSADGGNPSKVYDRKGACEPHFTPDGQLIVYETETNICSIRPDGKQNRMVTYQAGVQRYGRPSPDGRHIVYCQGVSERGPWELYVVLAKGGVPAKLTEGGSDMNPHWK